MTIEHNGTRSLPALLWCDSISGSANLRWRRRCQVMEAKPFPFSHCCRCCCRCCSCCCCRPPRVVSQVPNIKVCSTPHHEAMPQLQTNDGADHHSPGKRHDWTDAMYKAHTDKRMTSWRCLILPVYELEEGKVTFFHMFLIILVSVWSPVYYNSLDAIYTATEHRRGDEAWGSCI